MTSVAKPGAARAIADLDQGTILAQVEIAAPPERVFTALTDPAEVVRWWGSPELYRTTSWLAELRPGGAFRAQGVGADGTAFEVVGEILEVDAPRKLVFTWKPDFDGGHTTTVSYRLEALAAGGTRLTLRHEGFAGRRDSCASHGQGWELVLGWLQAHVAPAAAKEISYFLCKLIAPRPTFPIDMSEHERKVMHEHVAYWQAWLAKGVAVVFGPVMDPSGPWGAGVVGVSDAAQLKELQENDPVMRAQLGFRHEAYPMPGAIARP
jgi:uncharacterized protein YndB with AHSA1/START domain